MAAATLSYEDLGLIQGEGWLFRHLDVHIRPRDRLALIGRNGAGKTTLLKCLAGLIDTDEGRRTIVPGSRVVLLEQDPDMGDHATLFDWVLDGADAPETHEAAASAVVPQSFAPSLRSRTSLCSTSRPTISIWPGSNGWKNG